MGLLDKLTAGAERAAKEAEKAFDKGKTKVGELQIEMQLDGSAKKLGYIVFDFYRGRQVDQEKRQNLLDEMSRLEDQLLQVRAEAAAKAQAAGGGSQSAGTSPESPEYARRRGRGVAYPRGGEGSRSARRGDPGPRRTPRRGKRGRRSSR